MAHAWSFGSASADWDGSAGDAGFDPSVGACAPADSPDADCDPPDSADAGWAPSAGFADPPAGLPDSAADARAGRLRTDSLVTASTNPRASTPSPTSWLPTTEAPCE